jgi:aspartate 1-decarboxylase
LVKASFCSTFWHNGRTHQNEKLGIYDVINGSRFITYLISGKPGSGEVGVNGGAAHKVSPGDLVVILAAFGWMTAEEACAHRPKSSSLTPPTASLKPTSTKESQVKRHE